jgi:hypothetical protein
VGKVRFEREGDVGVITLADPPLNLFSMQLKHGIESLLAHGPGQAKFEGR